MMVAIKSVIRLAFVAHLVFASLLFPTLHLHLIDDHAHEADEIHRHGIVHAHFLVSLAGDHSAAPGIHHDAAQSYEDESEIRLVTLTSHKLKPSDQPFNKQLYLLTDRQRKIVVTTFFRAVAGKPDSPPHDRAFAYLGLPRSPPAFV
jgi:hypothetical protein